MRALEVMNNFVLRAEATNRVRDVASAMRDHRVGLVCICDENQVPIGVVTDRDLTLRVCAEGACSETTQIQSVMSPSPVTCGPNASLDEIHQLMNQNEIARVLVIDESGRVVGVVSLAEIWHYESPLSAGPVSRRVTERELRVHAPSQGATVRPTG